ncbi:low molecular weight phosphatase family protein [Nocardia amikacinitolerans]|uniref:Protein-tyrosine phosphatase n=1 Tax=Nocardia amikacinitolerans TaxID=756689 RepID=A0A285LXV4_9NOCA|nr:low molecular weight phosphatase family protein [Nocardia amikacinitolerans]MCP2280612.1 protein-tyrosine phosphatase [Nocardia amikacinitolerans]MCP2292458.1 protein-tyrosine phosphatase [Nocardia amikacinitolerans]MCP2299280.1 protein-tyrosine phosphatase [Nocardia amikacinitolerans]SNY89742.1 protein-tyrosine phosphatase [Nocardia amikacinitolerans]
MHVLFVCNGNVCRSVIAERLTRALAVEHDLAGLTAESAGTRALVGFPIEPLTAQTISGLGANPDGFRARKLKPEMIDRADLVLAMTEQIRDQAADMAFGAAARTFTLLEAHRIAKVTGARTVADMNLARNDLSLVGRENIADPVGLSEAAYCEVGDRIAEALVPLMLALAPHEQARPEDDDRTGLVLQPGAAPAPLSAFLAAQRIR